MTDTTNPLLDTRALPRFAEITADHIAPLVACPGVPRLT